MKVLKLLGMAVCCWVWASCVRGADPLPAALALHGMDYLQTLKISESCRSGGGYYEQNPILGRCPSKAEVGRYFISTAVAGLVLREVLPTRYKHAATWVWVAVGTGAVAHNYNIGIRVGF